jgi:hypothetical protein
MDGDVDGAPAFPRDPPLIPGCTGNHLRQRLPIAYPYAMPDKPAAVNQVVFTHTNRWIPGWNIQCDAVDGFQADFCPELLEPKPSPFEAPNPQWSLP